MRISVIIPIYNCEKWLDACIQSVVSQSKVREVLLIDDGSTDRSLQIAKHWEAKDDRIKRYHHPNRMNRGRSATRNVGINNANEDWVAFLDADDTYLPHRFDHLKANDLIDGIYDSIKTEYAEEKLKNSFEPLYTGIKEKLKCEDLIEHLIAKPEEHFSLNGLVVKKSCLIHIGGFDESLVLGEDTDLIWRLADLFCLMPSGLKKPVATRRVHSDNSFHNQNALNQGRFLFYKKWRTFNLNSRVSQTAQRKILNSYLAYHPVIINGNNPVRSRFIKLVVLFFDYFGIKL